MTVVYGLGAAVGWAGADYFAMRATRGMGAVSALLWILIAGVPATALLAAAFDGAPSGDAMGHDVAFAVLSGIGDAIAFGMLLLALKLGELAIVAPLAATSGGIAAGVGLLLGASLSDLAIVGLPLAVGGAALAATAPGARGTVEGLLPALATAVAAAGVFVALGQVHHLHAFTTALVARVTAIAVIGPLAARRGALRLDPAYARYAIAAGVLDGFGYAAYAAAASLGPIPIASVTATQAATLGVIVGIVVLHERPARHQLVGIAVTVIAVSLLALGGTGA